MDVSEKKIDYKLISISLILIGVILRLVEYLHCRSLWLDEVYVALNVLWRSPSDLFLPLEFGQYSPIGFLLLQKLAVVVFGNNDYSFRLFPLLFSLSSIIIFYKLAKNYLSKAGSLLALSLFVTCVVLIHYSSEGKPYSGDVFFSILLLYLSSKSFKDDFTFKDLTIFSIVGMLSVWLSFSSAFVLAGIGVSIIIFNLKKIVKFLPVFLFWAISFYFSYTMVATRAIDDSFTTEVFNKFYLPNPLSIETFTWGWKLLFVYFASYTPLSKMAIVALIIGFGRYLFTDIKRLSFLFLPIFFMMIGAYLHKYPMWQRFLLFILPMIFILISHGVECITSFFERRYKKLKPFAITTIYFLLFIFPLIAMAYNVTHPISHQEIKPALSYIRSNIKKGDVIYVHSHLQYAFRYYSGKYGFKNKIALEMPVKHQLKNRVYKESDSTIIVGIPSELSMKDKNYFTVFDKDLNRLKGNQRVWLLLSDMKNRCFIEKNYFVEYLNKLGKKKDLFNSPGIKVYLYDLSNS